MFSWSLLVLFPVLDTEGLHQKPTDFMGRVDGIRISVIGRLDLFLDHFLSFAHGCKMGGEKSLELLMQVPFENQAICSITLSVTPEYVLRHYSSHFFLSF